MILQIIGILIGVVGGFLCGKKFKYYSGKTGTGFIGALITWAIATIICIIIGLIAVITLIL